MLDSGGSVEVMMEREMEVRIIKSALVHKARPLLLAIS